MITVISEQAILIVVVKQKDLLI